MTTPLPIQRSIAGGLSGNGITFSLSEGWEAPAAGNVIVVYTAFQIGNRNTTVPTGYTLIGRNTGGGGGGRPTVAAYGKISDGTESSVLVDWSGTPDKWVAMIEEYDAQSALVDPAKHGDGQNSVNSTTQGSGLTSSVEGYAAAVFASHEQNGEVPAYSNGFVHDVSVLSGGASDLVMDIGRSDANEDVAGTYGITATWTNASNRAGICLAVDVTYVNGEKLEADKYLNTYKVTNFAGQPLIIETPGNDNFELVGLNYGQARKYRRAVTTPALIKREIETP